MPKFLIVAATAFEIKGVMDHFKITAQQETGLFSSDNITALISGVGMVNTAYHMGRLSHHDFDFVINAGVCGAFNRRLHIGEIVTVVTDTISELGAEDDQAFIKYPEMGLGGTHTYFPKTEKAGPLLSRLKPVNAITVNKVHGNDTSIQTTTALFNPDVESMEGAAFLRGCEDRGCDYFQLRAVSNYVEKRDKSKWNMPMAINNLNTFLIELITNLNKSHSL